jgi:hypothetical protein
MNLTKHQLRTLGLLTGCLLMGTLVGCQTTVGGQTLPSPDYLRDDIQYFPAGPEFLLPNTERAMQEYKAAQQGDRATPYNPSP